MTTFFARLCAVSFLLLLSPHALSATLSGRVWESPSNTPTAGTNITISNCGQTQTVKTSNSGSFRAQVSPGTCQITVHKYNSPIIAIIVSGDSAVANLEMIQTSGQWRLVRR